MSAREPWLAAPLDAVRARWSARRDEFARFHATVDGARLCDELLADLDAVEREQGGALLTLTEAAQVAGLSIDHLSRLVRTGAIPNAGRKHAPRIRRADLPTCRHVRAVVSTADCPYDPVADARSLAQGRLHTGDEHGTT